ncbi:hypothetical protein QUH73_13640 [Labilibaculum sp. K2S]|uniref:hypothetical protein n=1 Tax=Labilibaculum sp. K2S TaxID=3056386 RepID=UPI0025A4796B|nr:hypothetical protein [Labilibaculum sp. K2S]MDM8160861.1 hypothetical protein [Labilibaculum sp. K2S]
MTTSYINSEEFDKQLAEKKLNAENVAEILNLEISIAKSVFAGYKSIGEFEILKLHELAGFSYSKLITKEKTLNKNRPIKKEPNKNDSNLKDTKLNIYRKINCEKCDFLIYNPVNFCPNCGELIPQIIKQDKAVPEEDESSNE